MTDLFDQLSRLYDGDLPEDDARALRQRIATEPEVAQAWDELTAMVSSLEALPNVLPDPPAVTTPPVPVPANRPVWPIAAASAVAAAVLVATLLLTLRPPAAPVTMALGHGVHAIDGQATVHVMGLQVDVDGRAALSVEPAGDLPRVGVAEDPMNALTHAAALATGAILTVTVYEGTAAVRGGEQPTATIVTPDAPLSVTAPARAHSPAAEPPPSPDRPVAHIDAPPPQDAALVAALEAELEQVRERALAAETQLAQFTGEPQPWPADVHPAMQPEAFTDAVQQAVAEIPDAGLLEVDCSEYPCIAHIDVPPGAQDDMDALVGPLADALSPGEDGPGLMVMMNQSDDGTGPMATLSVSLAEQGAEGPAPRLETRVRQFNEEGVP